MRICLRSLAVTAALCGFVFTMNGCKATKGFVKGLEEDGEKIAQLLEADESDTASPSRRPQEAGDTEGAHTDTYGGSSGNTTPSSPSPAPSNTLDPHAARQLQKLEQAGHDVTEAEFRQARDKVRAIAKKKGKDLSDKKINVVTRKYIEQRSG